MPACYFYFDRRAEEGIYWLSPFGTCLELSNESNREREGLTKRARLKFYYGGELFFVTKYITPKGLW